MDCERCKYHPQEKEWDGKKLCRKCYDFAVRMETPAKVTSLDFYRNLQVVHIAQEAGV